jgi:protein-disulfide isomerase
MDTYKSDYESGAVLSIINADIEAGKNLGVVGTPTFFIDGMKIEDIESVASVDGLTKVIQDAIDAKNNGQ